MVTAAGVLMHKTNSDIFTLTLRLKKSLIAEIDLIAGAMRMSRTAWIRRAISRNLSYSKQHELPVVQRPDIQAVLAP